MNLQVIGFSGETNNIPLTCVEPLISDLDDEILFFENYKYKIILDASGEDKRIDDLVIRIGDFDVPSKYNEDMDYYETNTDILFNDCFDVSSVSVFLELSDSTEVIYYSKYFRVATKKETIEAVNNMLNVIENKIPNLLETIFSTSQKSSTLKNASNQSIWAFIDLVDEVIFVFEETSYYFANQKKFIVEQVPEIVSAQSMRQINLSGLRWIINNPENLIKTTRKKVIELNGEYFTPLKIKTLRSNYSYNVYENQVILTFLREVKEKLTQLIDAYNQELISIERIPDKIIKKLPNTHELTGRCVYIFYKSILEKLIKRFDRISELHNKYAINLECKEIKFLGIPRLTNTFKRIYQYRVCYDVIVNWFNKGGYSLQHLSYLFRLKSLSRIFEYYILIQLHDAIGSLNYRLINFCRVNYDSNEMEIINNKYTYEFGDIEITLLYEPIIWTNRLNGETNLYSRGYNFIKGQSNTKWKPDFIIKIKSSEVEYYYILDAKYSRRHNVKKIYMPQLVLKYSAQIASYNKKYADVIGVGAIFPSDKSELISFTRNYVKSSEISFPQYFAIGISQDIESLKKLATNIKRLLLVIDERGKKDRDFQLFEKDRQKSLGEITVNNNLDLSSLQKGNNKLKNIGGNNFKGKQCFYNGKNQCLILKKICIGKAVSKCDSFTMKDSKELFNEAVFCRNFIINKSGRKSVGMCKISGKLGCVGTECKFLLRKKNIK